MSHNAHGMFLRSIAFRLPVAIRSSLFTAHQTRLLSLSHSPMQGQQFSFPLQLPNPQSIVTLQKVPNPFTANPISPNTESGLQTYLERNKAWAHRTAEAKPDLFPALAKSQHPSILWIGCSDSRAPETTLLDLDPGQVFVHRNIANVLPATDLSSQSVIYYAVEHLKVQHVVVCGHIGCGGVNAALANGSLGLLDTWLAPVRRLREENAHHWEHLDAAEKAVKLIEANVEAGVRTVRENAVVIKAEKASGLKVHGCVYDVGTGLLRELKCDEEKKEHEDRVDAFELK